MNRPVVFVEPNQPVIVDYPAIVISRLRYIELIAHEMLARQHGLIQ